MFSRPGVVSGAAEESAGGEAEAEGGRAEQTLCNDLDDPQPQQRQDEEWRQPVALINGSDESRGRWIDKLNLYGPWF